MRHRSDRSLLGLGLHPPLLGRELLLLRLNKSLLGLRHGLRLVCSSNSGALLLLLQAR